jgi:restriction endonuclease S subunit
LARKSQVAEVTAPPANGSLPKGWRMARFDDIGMMVNDRVDPSNTDAEVYVGLEHLDSDSLTLRRWGTPSDVIGDKLRFQKGDIIFGRRRAYQRKLAVAEFDGICSAHAMVVRAKTDAVDPGFLPFLMQSDLFMQRAIDISVGSLSPTINWKTLRIQEFPLPPKEEQRRIADLLWAADEAVEKWRSSRDTLAVLKTCLMTLRFRPGSDRRKTGFRVVALEEVARVQTGIAKGREYDAIPTVELPYLRVANVQDGFLDLSEIKTITVAVNEVDRFRVKVGDVLMTEGGDFDKLGRGTIWRGEIENCIHQNHVFCVRPNESQLLPEFLTYQTASPYGKAYFLKCAKKTSNLASINSTQVKQFPVLVPPLEEQRRIVGILKAVDAAASRIGSHIEMLNELKKQLTTNLLLGDHDVH